MALGGMRSSHYTVSRITQASEAGATMATLITEIIDCNRRLLEPALAILQGSPTVGFLQTDVVQLKEYIENQLQTAPLNPKPGLDPNAFKCGPTSREILTPT